jgi:hypothetical protein
MRNIILFLNFALLLAANLHTQPSNKTLPKCADISVIGIFFGDEISPKKILGDSIHLDFPAGDFPQVNFYNKTSSEHLTLFYHYGSIDFTFSEIRVQKTTKPLIKVPTLNIAHFVTGKNIHIGMIKKELITILGKKYNIEQLGDTVKVSYVIDNATSPFLEYYNIHMYYGDYKFKNNVLVEFKYGFPYP